MKRCAYIQVTAVIPHLQDAEVYADIYACINGVFVHICVHTDKTHKYGLNRFYEGRQLNGQDNLGKDMVLPGT